MALSAIPHALAQTDINDISSSQYLVQVVLGLGLILALIFGLSWGLKWVNRMTGVQTHKHVKVLSQTPLGIKEKLVVVEVANKKLLLGLTASNISLLHSFAEGEFEQSSAIEATPVATPSVGTGFQQLFEKVSGRSKH